MSKHTIFLLLSVSTAFGTINSAIKAYKETNNPTKADRLGYCEVLLCSWNATSERSYSDILREVDSTCKNILEDTLLENDIALRTAALGLLSSNDIEEVKHFAEIINKKDSVNALPEMCLFEAYAMTYDWDNAYIALTAFTKKSKCDAYQRAGRLRRYEFLDKYGVLDQETSWQLLNMDSEPLFLNRIARQSVFLLLYDALKLHTQDNREFDTPPLMKYFIMLKASLPDSKYFNRVLQIQKDILARIDFPNSFEASKPKNEYLSIIEEQQAVAVKKISLLTAPIMPKWENNHSGEYNQKLLLSCSISDESTLITMLKDDQIFTDELELQYNEAEKKLGTLLLKEKQFWATKAIDKEQQDKSIMHE